LPPQIDDRDDPAITDRVVDEVVSPPDPYGRMAFAEPHLLEKV